MNKTGEYDPGLMLFGDAVYFGMELGELELFLTSVAKFLKQSAKRLSGKYDRFGLDRGADYEDSLPDVLYTSVVAASITLLERQIQTIADVLQKAIQFPLKFGDLSGSWIERFPKYCKAAAGFDVRENQQQWQDISDVVAVRNCLVHSDGDISVTSSQSRRAMSFIKRHDLDCIRDKRIVPDRALSHAVLRLTEEFIEETYRIAQQKYPKD